MICSSWLEGCWSGSRFEMDLQSSGPHSELPVWQVKLKLFSYPHLAILPLASDIAVRISRPVVPNGHVSHHSLWFQELCNCLVCLLQIERHSKEAADLSQQASNVRTQQLGPHHSLAVACRSHFVSMRRETGPAESIKVNASQRLESIFNTKLCKNMV